MERRERRLPAAFLLFLPLLCVCNAKSTVSWCVSSDAEQQKCLDLAGNATARNIRGTLQCVRGLNTRDCMDRIKNGTADAASMFADDIYAAGLCHGLELAAGESHNGVVSEERCGDAPETLMIHLLFVAGSVEPSGAPGVRRSGAPEVRRSGILFSLKPLSHLNYETSPWD
ncbi:Otolith matrix protein 1 [Liparis tanakae]|uniref:Otolith matrix protein 1 n=1 Tax=Liparis tanakae TaxID=230148 RepID=A0A4Z2FD35_9TELE|nr:Otolith matrix protein 1 [Liparis tanakae]